MVGISRDCRARQLPLCGYKIVLDHFDWDQPRTNVQVGGYRVGSLCTTMTELLRMNAEVAIAFRSDLNRSESRDMSERLLKTLRKSGDFQAEYAGSIPFTPRGNTHTAIA